MSSKGPHTRGDKGEASMQGSQGTSGLLSSRVCLLLKADGRKTERGEANSMDTRPKSHCIGALQNAHTHTHTNMMYKYSINYTTSTAHSTPQDKALELWTRIIVSDMLITSFPGPLIKLVPSRHKACACFIQSSWQCLHHLTVFN